MEQGLLVKMYSQGLTICDLFSMVGINSLALVLLNANIFRNVQYHIGFFAILYALPLFNYAVW